MRKDRTLILSGLGLNCEKETAYACEQSGAHSVEVVHLLKFLKGEINLAHFQFLIFTGGFLDGDHLGAAKVCANRIKYGYGGNDSLKADLLAFIKAEKPVLGICNGFQLLTKLGLLPDETFGYQPPSMALAPNRNGQFENRWVHLRVNTKSPCLFTKNLDSLYLPVRHGEGRLVVGDPNTESRLLKNQQVVLTYADKGNRPTPLYPDNPNGSWNNAAGICSPRGNLFGLMPHPEAYTHYTNHPHWTRHPFTSPDGEGLLIFKNAYRYLQS